MVSRFFLSRHRLKASFRSLIKLHFALGASIDYLNKQSRTGLSTTAVTILLLIDLNDKILVSELKDITGLSDIYFSTISKGLETKGLIALSTLEKDRRQKIIGITDKGSKTLAPIKKRLLQKIFESQKSMDAQDVQGMQKYIQTLKLE